MKLVHEARKLFLVSLSDGPEKALFDSTSGRTKILIGIRAIGEEVSSMPVCRHGKESCNVVVQGVLILLQPSLR